mgnify:CR=1 FL=1
MVQSIARRIVAVFGIFILCVGLFIIAVPAGLAESANWVLNPAGVAFAGSFRVALGIILWLASDRSRTPRTFKVLGVLTVLGGITVFVIGVPGLTSIVEWGTSKGHGFMRGAGVFAACLGAFLAWSAMPAKGAE